MIFEKTYYLENTIRKARCYKVYDRNYLIIKTNKPAHGFDLNKKGRRELPRVRICSFRSRRRNAFKEWKKKKKNMGHAKRMVIKIDKFYDFFKMIGQRLTRSFIVKKKKKKN